MEKKLFFMAVCLVYSYATPLWADDSNACYENSLAVEATGINTWQNSQWIVNLPSTGSQGQFITNAKFHLAPKHDSLAVFIDFETTNIGLPYNIYAVQITSFNPRTGVSKSLINVDYTFQCASTGYALFPRGILNLETIPNMSPDDMLSVKIWGHL